MAAAAPPTAGPTSLTRGLEGGGEGRWAWLCATTAAGHVHVQHLVHGVCTHTRRVDTHAHRQRRRAHNSVQKERETIRQRQALFLSWPEHPPCTATAGSKPSMSCPQRGQSWRGVMQKRQYLCPHGVHACNQMVGHCIQMPWLFGPAWLAVF